MTYDCFYTIQHPHALHVFYRLTGELLELAGSDLGGGKVVLKEVQSRSPADAALRQNPVSVRSCQATFYCCVRIFNTFSAPSVSLVPPSA